jgi:hypothetical protein
VDIIGGIALVLLIIAVVTALRRAGSPARYPGAARSRARPGGTGRRAAGARQHRKSWLVTAAKAAGVNLTGDHLDDATAELAGRATGATVRAGHRRWRRLVGLAGRRWEARGGTVREPLMFWRRTPADDSHPDDPADPPGSPDPAPGGKQATGAAASGQPPPANSAAGTGTGPAPATFPTLTPASAPPGAERSRTTMTARYAINLEPPTTDGEFLESCVQLGDVLKSLADQIGEWADGLSALNLPQSVLSPLHQVSEGITDAADGATKAATAFENEFEDARDVAARGMHFTGQDAA